MKLAAALASSVALAVGFEVTAAIQTGTGDSDSACYRAQGAAVGGCVDTGGQAASGVYFYKLRAEDRVLTRRMVLIK